MARFIDHHVAPEMVCLWLVEVLFCFAVLHALLAASGTGAPDAANQAALLALTVGLTSFAVGLYRCDLCLQDRRLVIAAAIGAAVAFAAAWLTGLASGIDLYRLAGPWLSGGALAAWALALVCTRLLLRGALRLKLFVRRVVIVGAEPDTARTAAAIAALRPGYFEVAAMVPLAGADAPARESAQRVSRHIHAGRVHDVVIAPDARSALAREDLLRWKQAGVRIHDTPEFWEAQLRRIDIELVDDDWDLFARALSAGRVQSAASRGFDVLVSLALLVATLPLMGLAALLIRLDSPGPVLYRQERVGLYGRSFTLFKFRSMRTDAEAGGPAWAAKGDPRVTRIGAFLRRMRIDELPQLVNVLRGEMSFVGPRPERPHFVEQLCRSIPLYRDRAYVKPGITGWAQVNFPYGASIEDARMKLSYDLYYVKHRSLLLDVLILLSTIRVILFQEGAR